MSIFQSISKGLVPQADDAVKIITLARFNPADPLSLIASLGVRPPGTTGARALNDRHRHMFEPRRVEADKLRCERASACKLAASRDRGFNNRLTVSAYVRFLQ